MEMDSTRDVNDGHVGISGASDGEGVPRVDAAVH